MINIIKAFKEVWSYPLSKKDRRALNASREFGKNELGVSEFFKTLEVFSKSRKYSFK
jgi:hypothetical protein